MGRLDREARISLVASIAVALALLSVALPPRPTADATESKLKGRIAYAADIDGDYELFVMRPDGSHRRRLTYNKFDDVNPAWAPGGRRLVFEREKGAYSDLYILNLRSGRSRAWLTSRHIDEGDPEWAPNGRWIAYRGNDGGDGSDVLASRLDLSKTRIISSQDENSSNVDPTWSSTGKRIALVERYEESDIFVARFCCSDRYDKRRISSRDGYNWEGDLDWSPAGDCLLYSRWNRSGFVDAGSSLYVLSIARRSARQIYSDDGDAYAGSWSPDGRRIVFTSDVRGSHDVYVADRDGGNVRRLVSSRANEVTPAWYGRSQEPQQCGGTGPNAEPEPSPSESPSPSPSFTLPLP